MKRIAGELTKGLVGGTVALAIVVVTAAVLGVHVSIPGDRAAKPDKPEPPYIATPQRTQLYRSGAKGDAVLYRVVDMPAEGLRCVMLVGNGAFGRGVSCVKK